VDVDPAELNRPTVRPETAIVADARDFLTEMNHQLDEGHWDTNQFAGWLTWCKQRVKRYPAVGARQREFNGKINPYHFIETLFNHLQSNDVVVTGNATACIVSFQTAQLKLGQRLFSNSGSASMGYDLPAAIGAAVAHGKRVICLAGDGSLQMNVQELQTVAQYNLPVKIIVLNNEGYLSIRTSQKNFFGATVGEGPASGVSFPDYVKLAEVYGIPATRIAAADFGPPLLTALDAPGPALIEVMLDPAQGFEPRQSSRPLPDGRIVSAPLEDMFPFLDRDELRENLLIPEWVE
jgi:acetolactate synthase-1/2/3 large subunit